ncbi:MAG: SusC/RagA family TonB-linked outer membrane protein [Cyclobacteriaceae bacterium]
MQKKLQPKVKKSAWERPVLFLLLLMCTSTAWAQFTVSGNVTSGEDQFPLPGVNIIIKGTTNGTITDVNGDYSITVPSENDVLLFSFVGFNTQEVAISGRSNISLELSSDAKQLSEIVVTALGVERDKKALGYATQEISGDDMTQARESNMVSGLSGKMAGVQVLNSGTTIGGSARVSIRGESSLDINGNQPLFIVNGIPISNQVVGSSGSNNLEVDYGNGAAEINPDDIESINVLKGPAAAALYGSRAANGAIIITTKSGKGKKGLGISVNSNATFETPLRLPEWQNTYGQGNNGQFSFVDGAGSGIADGVDESWGPRLDGQLIPQFDSPRSVTGFRGGDLNAPAGSTITPTPWVPAPNNIDDFFETGKTFTNSVAVSHAGDFGTVRFSWTNLDQTGILPNTDLKRNTLALSSSLDLSEKLNVTSSINYIDTESKNRPSISYGTESLMYLWIWYGRQINTTNLKDYWMPGMEGRQQFNYNYNYHDNPYFTSYENTNGQGKARLLGNVSATYKFTDNISLMLRTGTDFYNELRDRRRAFSTQRFPNGMYREDDIFFNERNSDFLLSYSKNDIGNWSVNVSLGGNQMKQIQEYQSTVAPQLLIPELYNFSNTAVQLQIEENNTEKRINSLYGYTQLGYKNMIFLDLTGRNDWSSTLPVDNNSYFYPSATLSAVISDMTTLPEVLDFAKIRVAYAEVGNDTDPYSLVNVYNSATAFGGNQAKSESSTLKNAELKPERTTSYELGADLRFFGGRFGVDFTYYLNKTRDQILPISLDQSTGYTAKIINAGEIENKGIEIMVNAEPIKFDNGLNWRVNLNFSRNRSKVLELAEGIGAYTLTERNGAFVQARVGEQMGSIYGVGFARVEDANSPYNGQIIHSAEGTPLRGTDLVHQGNYNPDFMLGIQNSLKYKGFNLGFLFDIRQGGIVVSRTKTIGSTSGQLAETLYGRENGYDLTDAANGIISEGVIDNGDGTYTPNTIKISSRDWHNRYYERNNVEAAKYDASYTKLREVKLGYTLPQRLLGRLPFQNVNFSVVGRNLMLWTENPHFDPDVMSMSGGTLQPGVENMAYPSTRSIGFNLSFNL